MGKKILVGLSGGVDSAVSALLLQQQGFHVVGGFMINYKDINNPNCTTKKDLQSAQKVADFLGIKLLKFNFVEEYQEKILNYMFEGYKRGITPNPDVLCNNLIKFQLFLQKALDLGFDKIAMGHYSRIIKKNGIFELYQGRDKNKDQSYFLSGLNQFQLSKSILPLGDLTKQEVREVAVKNNLPNSNRPDSQGLCFVGKVNMKDFIYSNIGKKKGKILTKDGIEVGEHNGAWAWTIGQRRGLNINKPAFVVGTDIVKNIVFITYNKNDPLLWIQEVVCLNRHWVDKNYYSENSNYKINDSKIDFNNQQKISKKDFFCKLRYRQEKQKCIFTYNKKDNIMKVILENPIWGVANGQIAVLYENEKVLGNGIINT